VIRDRLPDRQQAADEGALHVTDVRGVDQHVASLRGEERDEALPRVRQLLRRALVKQGHDRRVAESTDLEGHAHLPERIRRII
jgi:hypothetical protein